MAVLFQFVRTRSGYKMERGPARLSSPDSSDLRHDAKRRRFSSSSGKRYSSGSHHTSSVKANARCSANTYVSRPGMRNTRATFASAHTRDTRNSLGAFGSDSESRLSGRAGCADRLSNSPAYYTPLAAAAVPVNKFGRVDTSDLGLDNHIMTPEADDSCYSDRKAMSIQQLQYYQQYSIDEPRQASPPPPSLTSMSPTHFGDDISISQSFSDSHHSASASASSAHHRHIQSHLPSGQPVVDAADHAIFAVTSAMAVTEAKAGADLSSAEQSSHDTAAVAAATFSGTEPGPLPFDMTTEELSTSQNYDVRLRRTLECVRVRMHAHELRR